MKRFSSLPLSIHVSWDSIKSNWKIYSAELYKHPKYQFPYDFWGKMPLAIHKCQKVPFSISKIWLVNIHRRNIGIKLLHVMFVWTKRGIDEEKSGFLCNRKYLCPSWLSEPISICKHEPRWTFFYSLLCFALFYCVFGWNDAVTVTWWSYDSTLSSEAFKASHI